MIVTAKTMHRLSPDEIADFKWCEEVIEQAESQQLEEGKALKRIRDARLYRGSHDTFEWYCRDRWNFSPQHAGRLISYAEVAEDLEPIGSIPTIESHARPLIRRRTWSEVEVTGRKHTALLIAEIARRVRSIPVNGPLTSVGHRVAPLISPTKCFGKKWTLAGTITSLFPTHSTYIEPFFGSGTILFAKVPAKIEIVNDLNSETVNFFQVLWDHGGN